ncbi:hypothetical protein JCM8547_000490 [Rhodosporidiobolus lusitaniae]
MQLPSTTRTVVIQQPYKSGFDNLIFEDRPLAQPKANEVVVRVKAVSLNARDCQVASGTYPALANLKNGLVAGSDAAGDVVAIGEGVKLWKFGDRVSPIFSQGYWAGDCKYQQPTALGGGIDGVLTEYFVVNENDVVKIPDHLTYAQASTSVITGVTSWHCLFGHPGQVLKAGQAVLILGTGGVSIYSAQLALANGAEVIVTSSSDDKLARIQKEVGSAIKTINYGKIEKWDEEVLRLTGGRGVDHVIEIAGGATLPKSVRSTKRGGNIWVVGYLSDLAGQDTSEMAKLGVEILIREVGVRGVMVGNREHYEELNRCVELNKIVPIVDKVLPFDQVKEAYRASNKGAFGKVVVELA